MTRALAILLCACAVQPPAPREVRTQEKEAVFAALPTARVPDAQPPALHGRGPGSAVLRNGAFRSPLPGGVLAGYAGDTGLDIAENRKPVFAIADGILEYSEKGHTRWVGKGDTPFSVRIRLDKPIAFHDRTITHAYYTHMSELTYAKSETDIAEVHVAGGTKIGISGIGRGMPHLHIGLLLESRVEQDSWDSLLTESQIREVFGDYRNRERLP
jgi:murein DD-endopeptidase MepM/ murein hydrolase activator NlpD